MLFFLVGFMGSGKTFYGKKWALKYDLQFFDLDSEIETTANKPVSAIFSQEGESYFRQLEKSELQKFEALQRTIISCGGGTVMFGENMQWMNNHGITIFLNVAASELYLRLKDNVHDRPLLLRYAANELYSGIATVLNERLPWYRKSKIHIRPEHIDEFLLNKIFSLSNA